MTKQILFDNKEECLEYYRQVAREHGDDWDDRKIILMYSLYKDYSEWFKEPELTEQEKKEGNEILKKVQALREVRRSQKKKTHVA